MWGSLKLAAKAAGRSLSRLRLGLQSGVFSATRVRHTWTSLRRVGIRFTAWPGARRRPPSGSVSRRFTHLGASALGLRNGATAVAGRWGLAREAGWAVGVDSVGAKEATQCQDQGATQLCSGIAAGEGRAHDASLRRSPKKTYGARRLSKTVTWVIGPTP